MSQKSLPPLNWLRAFEVSARCLNFTHAAEELHLTQGAVSQQIRQLESHLGVALFKRLPRGLGLTEEGQSYLPVVQDAISRLAVGTNEIFGQRNRRHLKVRGSLSFLHYWLAPRLADFCREYPQIDIRYISNIWVKEPDGEDDLEIRWGCGEWSGLHAQRLTWDILQPVCSPKLMASSPIHEPRDLMNHSLLHVLGYEEGWGYWLKRVGADDVDYSRGLQFDTLISTIRMAELGQGVALARSSVVEDLLKSGQLVAPFNHRIEASESFYLVHEQNEALSPDAAHFSTWLVAQAHRLL
ncbi:LysR family glycine cleavage system transcriptional activator [Pseudomonas sp. PvR086]|jgi:LysR family glycine cleavage system transcriptional activator|uniref:LysR substrate-binding domain-containing protein n=1 Tax=Pseudomonas TaxID=286 RepID=UPI0007E2E264|nr:MULTISPECIES: LysR substrate-binding domain-containing protein [Pseudomonas]MBD9604366.1 LysR family transcriptional regulator [Pseudomonas sp. PDM08]MDR7104733.1 LysR family glycine cleavage system transcriptional activator [Pseudomonas frederiksbergensis]PMY52678.1 LysR family transcriptional regulator [Pseudomonas sp. FW305-53]PMY87029.1 LysR family transcriptional regulator [Pseudomonas sp. FW303-C2]PMY92647.1 LysR family transcriptional regulator [Pseudomonas sp. FW305-62]